MKILLIRHTEQDYPLNAEGKKMISLKETPLSKLGEKQAHQLAMEIKRFGSVPEVLFVSPYLRAQQTARILQEDLGISNLETVYDLREIDPNGSEGHLLEDVELAEKGFKINWGPSETLEHLIDRQRHAFKEIFGKSEGKFSIVGIVSHGDPLCAMYWAIRNEGHPSLFSMMKKDYYPQKGDAYEFTFENGRVIGESQLISLERSDRSIERK